jgi:hypothetical protein
MPPAITAPGLPNVSATLSHAGAAEAAAVKATARMAGKKALQMRSRVTAPSPRKCSCRAEQ